MAEFRIEIASVPDREKLVAEIWFGSHHVADLNQDSGLRIELYNFKGMDFDFNEYLKSLEEAKRRLLSS